VPRDSRGPGGTGLDSGLLGWHSKREVLLARQHRPKSRLNHSVTAPLDEELSVSDLSGSGGLANTTEVSIWRSVMVQ
jgi:hypothetical protein